MTVRSKDVDEMTACMSDRLKEPRRIGKRPQCSETWVVRLGSDPSR